MKRESPHYVIEHETLLADLREKYDPYRALDLATGGNAQRNNLAVREVLLRAGVNDQSSLLDFGCGWGRAALVLPVLKAYIGIDVLSLLLQKGVRSAPKHYLFVHSTTPVLPLQNNKFDFACAFSVFTHLYMHETYQYLREIFRVLKPGGKLLFSFWEFADCERSWKHFEASVDNFVREELWYKNTFIERNVISVFAERIGFGPPKFQPSEPDRYLPFDQTLCTLRKPGHE